MFTSDSLRPAFCLFAAFAFFACACDDGDSEGGGGDGGNADVKGMGGDDGSAGMGGDKQDFGPDVDDGVDDEAGVVDVDDGVPPPDMGCAPCGCGQVTDPESCECGDSAEACEQDCDCAGNRVCSGGACEEGCLFDEECVALDARTHTCFDGRCGNCGEDDDCFGDSTCGDNMCQSAPECDDNRECVDGPCENGECVARQACGEDDCPMGWTCHASGECLPSVRCREAIECALNLTCVTSNPPVACGRCQENEDCPGTQACDLTGGEARCVETQCDVAEDCILGRECGGDGNCEPPACDDDNFEPNETFEDARDIAAGVEHRGLGGCNDDWFVFEIPARTQALVSLRQDGFTANLDLALHDADGEEIAASASGNQTDSAVAGPYGAARPIYVRVYQQGPESGVGYSLNIQFQAAGGCDDDPWEAGAGDDTPETGRIVRRAGAANFDNNTNGTICPGDVDWMCFQMGQRETLNITAIVVGGNATLVGVLFDDDGEPVGEDGEGEGRWPRGGAGQDIAVRVGGFICLRITTEDTAGDYEISLDAIPAEVVQRCDEGIDVGDEWDGGFSSEEELDDDDALAGRCAPGADSGEQVYHFDEDELSSNSLLVARVIGLPGGTLGDPVVSVRTDCQRANTEIGCSDGTVEPDQPLLRQPNPAVVRVPIFDCPREGCPEADDPDDDPPPCYCASVIVDGVDPGNAPNYRLEVSTRPLAAAPRNDECENAIPIEFRNGVWAASSSLDRATDSDRDCLGAGGPDTAYALSLATRARLTVQAASVGDDFAVGAYLKRDTLEDEGVRCDPESVACGFGFDQVFEPGEYVLVLDGADANARGRVEVQVTMEAFDDVPDNDTCDDALALEGDGGEREGDTRAAEDDIRLADGNGCTGFDTRGGDVVYTIDVDAGTYFVQAEPHGGWDLSLFVVGDCEDPLDDCEGADGALTETIVFSRNQDGEVTVVVDGSNGEGGLFTLRWGPADCAEAADCAGGQACVDFQCVD